MGTNIAMKRAAKANRRKAIVAEKRRSDMFAMSLAERVRRAASAPIQYCLMTEPLFDLGVGTVMLGRGVTAEYAVTGIFLVDVYCLGVKDVIVRPMTAEQFENYVVPTLTGSTMINVDPSFARKLLREVAVWAQSIGFPPHRDFAAVERLFGDVSADACLETFQFGRDGKPVYMPGLSESKEQIRQRMAQLRVRFGDQGFDVLTAA